MFPIVYFPKIINYIPLPTMLYIVCMYLLLLNTMQMQV